MFGLVCVTMSLINDLEWWFRYRQLRREAAEGADRLIEILEIYVEPLYATAL